MGLELEKGLMCCQGYRLYRERYWSGQLTPREVVEICRRYQVGQLLLKPDPGVEWMDLLPEYEAAYRSPERVVFVRKRGGGSE